MKRFHALAVSALFCPCLELICPTAATAASLSGSSQTFGAMNVDLTAEGALDWRQFGGITSGTTGSSFFNEKSGATELSVISNATNGARGSSGTTSTWTDGTPFPAASSDHEIRFAGGTILPRNIVVDAVAGLTDRRVRLYVAAHDGGNGTMTASLLNSANSPILSPLSIPLDSETDAMFEFHYTGDSPGDKLRIAWGISSLDVNALASADVTLAAITLAEVPEPASVGLTGFAAVFLRRRRNR